RKEVVLASFAAEAQAPMVMTDKAEFSTTIGTAVLRLSHDALLRAAGIGTAANFVDPSSFNSISAARLPATRRGAGGQVSTLHCREMSAELTFRNQVGEQTVRITQRVRQSPAVRPPQMWVEPATYSVDTGGAARRFRNCASSASSAQNSE